MTNRFPPILAIAGLVLLPLIAVGLPSPAQAKQQCSASMPSNAHRYWSWRLIDGRKCWYEGRPRLSKSLLSWDVRESVRGAIPVASDGPGSPLDAQAWASDDKDTFEARWRDRVGQQ